MQPIDWILVAAPIVFVIAFAVYTRRYVRSVADFMAGGRSAGRYLICNARGEAISGVANTMSKFQILMVSGFVLSWWDSLSTPIIILVSITGFMVYRYRETRAMTIGQFFETRYSRKFRLFTGVLGFISGLLNYGIFPAVSSRFFVYFLDLPESVHLFGLSIATYVLIMAFYLTATVSMMVVGGQVTLMVTDCVEGILSHIIYLVVIAAVFYTVSWSQMRTAITVMPPGKSMVNPFDALGTKDFNVWYSLMTLALYVYATLAWQNGNSFNSAARTPHESRMGSLLGNWRTFARLVMLVVLAMASLTFLNHPDFTHRAMPVHEAINAIADVQVRKQMSVPIALRYLLPAGIKGLFCTSMVLGLMAGDASHMLSWGGIFIQDIIVPLRKRPLEPREHIRILRLAVVGVALFAFFFSLFFRQTTYIVLWWAVTQAIFVSGAGIAIIGGLYWKKGTTSGAWAAVIAGAVLSVAGIIAQQKLKSFPLNGTQVSFLSTAVAIVIYGVVSWLSCRTHFNMDRMLHRGIYSIADDHVATVPPKFLHRFRLSNILGFNQDFTRLDKYISAAMFFWSMFWLAVVVVGTGWNVFAGLNFPILRSMSRWSLSFWVNYWFVAGILLPLFIAVVTLVWFGIGGIIDLRAFFTRLASLKRDATDDGTVYHDANGLVIENPRLQQLPRPEGPNGNGAVSPVTAVTDGAMGEK